MIKRLSLYLQKYWLLYGLGVALILAASTATLLYINPNVGFKHFEPTYLPPGVSIKTKRIGIFDHNVQTNQNFRTEDWVYSISEYKASLYPGANTIGSANQDFDPSSIKPTCNIRTSPAGVQYRVCHWVDYERINVHEVIFVKSGTYIRSTIPTALDQNISFSEMDRYVDSFVEKHTFGLPVLRANGA